MIDHRTPMGNHWGMDEGGNDPDNRAGFLLLGRHAWCWPFLYTILAGFAVWLVGMILGLHVSVPIVGGVIFTIGVLHMWGSLTLGKDDEYLGRGVKTFRGCKKSLKKHESPFDDLFLAARTPEAWPLINWWVDHRNDLSFDESINIRNQERRIQALIQKRQVAMDKLHINTRPEMPDFTEKLKAETDAYIKLTQENS